MSMMTTDEATTVNRPTELAPSVVAAESPSPSRVVGTTGLFFLVLGGFAVLAHQISSTPRLISEGYGFIAMALGLTLMAYHAARDSEVEMRRLYGLLALGLLVFALAAALVPGPVFTNTDSRSLGYNLPWAIPFAFVSLGFLAIFARNETEAAYRRLVSGVLLVVGGALTLGSVIAGAILPDFFAGPGLALAILGLAYLATFFSTTETSEGLGYGVALGLGIVSAVVMYAALARLIFPAVLAEGPPALKKPNGAFDSWKIAARLVGALAFVTPALIASWRKVPLWITRLLAAGGLIGVGVLLVGSLTTIPAAEMGPYLMPRGAALLLLGLVGLGISLGILSESQFVTLARRELAAYFTSPIGYLTLLGMTLLQWFEYRVFLERLGFGVFSFGGETVRPEPIVGMYFLDWLPVFAVMLQVPALTMRLVAEERRSGSLEVLLTAPVSETSIILSKFFATWLFYMICWLPAGLFLITLRLVNGEPFDYRPLLSFYLAMGACGTAFVATGLFFSSIAPNQLAAAVFSFVGMVGYFLCFFQKEQAFGLGDTFKVLMERLSFVDLWIESLKGQLPLKDVIAWLSLAGVWLFASVKVLEARRWK